MTSEFDTYYTRNTNPKHSSSQKHFIKEMCKGKHNISSTVFCIRVCSNDTQEHPLACKARRTNTTQWDEILRTGHQWVPEVGGCRCLRQRKIAVKEKQKGELLWKCFIKRSFLIVVLNGDDVYR